MAYELEMDGYKGPLDKLLELVEEKKLEITTVNLAEVTTDFLEYLRKIEEEKRNHELIADFLVIASRLVLIKSKVLLPSLALSEEEEVDIKNLEARLRLYQELKQTQAYVREGWRALPMMHAREFMFSTGAIFYPPANVGPETLHAAVGGVFGELQKILRPVAVVKREIINLREKIQEVFKRLTETPLSFSKLRKNGSRGEIVVLFLAVLHLIKDQLVQVEQEDHFGDILIAKNGVNPYNE